MNNKKAFSLIEISVVLAIIGVLTALAVPTYLNFVNQSIANNTEFNLVAIVNAQRIYYLNTMQYCYQPEPAGNPQCSVFMCGLGLYNLNANLKLNLIDNTYTYFCDSMPGEPTSCMASAWQYPLLQINYSQTGVPKIVCYNSNPQHPCPSDLTANCGSYYSNTCP